MAKLRDIAKKASEEKAQKMRDMARGRETVHMGGTPMFDEANGRYLTPMELILRKRLKESKK